MYHENFEGTRVIVRLHQHWSGVKRFIRTKSKSIISHGRGRKGDKYQYKFGDFFTDFLKIVSRCPNQNAKWPPFVIEIHSILL